MSRYRIDYNGPARGPGAGTRSLFIPPDVLKRGERRRRHRVTNLRYLDRGPVSEREPDEIEPTSSSPYDPGDEWAIEELWDS